MPELNYDTLIEELTGKKVKKEKQPSYSTTGKPVYHMINSPMSATMTAETDWTKEELALPIPEDAKQIRIQVEPTISTLVKPPSKWSITKDIKQYNVPFVLIELDPEVIGLVLVNIELNNKEDFPVTFTVTEEEMDIVQISLDSLERNDYSLNSSSVPGFVFTKPVIAQVNNGFRRNYRYGVTVIVEYIEIYGVNL